jgi:hypothetical protein
MFDKKEFEKALQEARLDEESKKTIELKDRIRVASQKIEKEQNLPAEKERKRVWGMHEADDMENSRDKWQSKSSQPSHHRYKKALKEGLSMKISELKQELKDRGISTAAFFEKIDMAKAYAEAIRDNVFKNASKNINSNERSGTGQRSEQIKDPSYRDVVVQKFDAGTILPGDTVIDITDYVQNAATSGAV